MLLRDMQKQAILYDEGRIPCAVADVDKKRSVTMKYKIEKNTVQETLIIPLYARKNVFRTVSHIVL